MSKLTRKQLLSSLNAKRNRLLKNGARGDELKSALGFDTERLGDLPTSKLTRFYEKSNKYGKLTVKDGAILPQEYINRVNAMAKFRGRDISQVVYRKSFDMAVQGYIMTEHTGVQNMLGKQRKHAKQVQKDYTQALKKHGLGKEAHKLSQMPRQQFYKFLNEVDYYGAFKFVYASDQPEGRDAQGVMNIKKAINNSKTYNEFIPNFKYR